MRKIWVKVDPWDKELILTALEGGADGIMVADGFGQKVKELGLVTVIASDGDLVPGKDAVTIPINSSDDEDEIIRLTKEKLVILECPDWTIIPLENLIARNADVVPIVKTYEEAETAFSILEVGVNQVMIHTDDAGELQKALSILKRSDEAAKIEEAEILEVKPIGMGDRVCVDTCTSMKIGQGMLVGNTSSVLFLVHAETVENPYVAPRPFRVNAGAVHAYTRVPGGKTRYLSELKAGDKVLLFDHKGSAEEAIIGRLKIEKRPMMLITAKIGSGTVATIVQNAETIRLTSPAGEPVSVVALKAGDKVLVIVEAGGRHFGHKIEETITEK